MRMAFTWPRTRAKATAQIDRPRRRSVSRVFGRRLDRRTVQDALAYDVPAKRISARCQSARRAGAEDERSTSAWTRHLRAGAVLGRSEIWSSPVPPDRVELSREPTC